MAISGLLVRDPILTELAAECLIDQHVHGLRDAHHCGERHSPCRVGEASGSADGDDAEDNRGSEAYQADVIGWDYFFTACTMAGQTSATIADASAVALEMSILILSIVDMASATFVLRKRFISGALGRGE